MKKRHLIPLIIILLMVLLNVTARLSTAFSDFYVMNIFPYISDAFSFISGLLPFSLGELLIIIGIITAVSGIIAVIILLIVRKDSRRSILSVFFSAALWIGAFILTTETMNCFIMYRCTKFSERYFPDTPPHTDAQLTELYGMMIDQANELAEKVKRDEKGDFILTADLMPCAKAAMKKAAEKYPQLKGYYPDAKPLWGSYFMSVTDTSGVYFPFSLEANYNADMLDINYPNVLCHEYAHLKGIIQEDEANFISYIASVGSDNADFQYSGTVMALEYVSNEIFDSEIEDAYPMYEDISDNVRNDWFRFLPDGYFEDKAENNPLIAAQNEIVSNEDIDDFATDATETMLEFNGVEDGMHSYCRMVDLLLDLYFPR